jgi:hypothetical protein
VCLDKMQGLRIGELGVRYNQTSTEAKYFIRLVAEDYL